MKILFLVLFSFLFFLSSYGQKKKSLVNKPRPFCTADSIEQYTVKNLTDSGVSLIMTFLYDFDNGRVSDAIHYILWIHKGKGYAKTIKGFDVVSIKDTMYPTQVHKLFNFYRANRIDTISRELKSDTWQSHDMGYFIMVDIAFKKKYLNVRNYQRRTEYKKDEKPPAYLSDPRVLFVNMFEELIKD